MLIKKIINAFRPRDITKVVVLGHQKGGTTVVANLIGRMTGLPVSIDPLFMIDYGQGNATASLMESPDTLKKLLRNRPDLFDQPIVKDPDLIFVYPSVQKYYDKAKTLFVVRHPLDTIRSISDRLGLQPDKHTEPPSAEDMKEGNKHWELILSGRLPRQHVTHSNYILNLANRWCLAVDTYLAHKSEIILARYEDFLLDKNGYIESIVEKLELHKATDISEYLDIQYQPKGNKAVNLQDYFGEANLVEVEKICGKYMKKIGYETKYISI